MRRRATLPDFVQAVGGDLRARLEEHPNPDYVDHVWISMDVGDLDRLIVSVNTQSKRNMAAGFDARVRVGVLHGQWKHLPPRGIRRCPAFDYAEIEKSANIYFEHHTRAALEELLLDTSSRSILLEAWGSPYHHKGQAGIHQIHSRRASCAMPEDVFNRDGALQFYFLEDQKTELFLFKFCGQP